jgi:hypothetical protein
MPERKINFDIKNGEVFFAHELSINFNPTQFVLDFKNVTPRVDPRSHEAPLISIKHNVILLEPYHTKKIIEFLSKRIKDYEKEFGKIEKPEALKALEKNRKKQVESRKDHVQTPSYFG